MADWQDGFRAALLEFLQGYRSDAVALTSWDDSCYAQSGCDTCGPDMEYEVDFYYLKADGKRGMYTYTGKFSQILEEILG